MQGPLVWCERPRDSRLPDGMGWTASRAQTERARSHSRASSHGPCCDGR